MKEYLSISEMAKLRNITIETLRHYDRIGLLPPDYTDHNRIRYYHITKTEKIRTIKELQEIGLSLKEIKSYMENRVLSSSYDLLLRKQEHIKKQYEFYKSMHSAITEKIEVLDSLSQQNYMGNIYVKDFPKRYCMLSDKSVCNDIELFTQTSRLENLVEKREGYLQIYGSQRYGFMFKDKSSDFKIRPLLFVSKSTDATVIPKGKYICMMKRGSFWNADQEKEQIRTYAEEKGYKLNDILLSAVQIDYTISDIEEERLYEIQWKINDEVIINNPASDQLSCPNNCYDFR